MKLAEALSLRADTQKRIQQVRERLSRSARVQDGEKPPEDPQSLLEELDRLVANLRQLIQRINRTNAQTTMQNGETLTDALAERDVLAIENSVINSLIQSASQNEHRYSRSEIKTMSTVNIASLQKRSDDLSRRYRELDTAIQQANWTVDLVE